jgi:hypothetical protein
MSDLTYMVWFLATAAMTITVLTVGTLGAAGMLPRRRARTGPSEPSGAPHNLTPPVRRR